MKDYENEQKRRNERKSKQNKVKAACDAEDEFNDATEARLSECVDKCQKEARVSLSIHLSSFVCRILTNFISLLINEYFFLDR